MTFYRTLNTALLGDLLLTASPTHLMGLYFADRKHAPVIDKEWIHNPRHELLQQAAEQLHDFLDGKRNTFSIPIEATGTDFQREVWRQIALIPFGQTITYSELASRAGASDAVRAAGTATGKNPLSIIVPCHRVIGKNGAPRGYAGGLDRKHRLLYVETNRLQSFLPWASQERVLEVGTSEATA